MHGSYLITRLRAFFDTSYESSVIIKEFWVEVILVKEERKGTEHVVLKEDDCCILLWNYDSENVRESEIENAKNVFFFSLFLIPRDCQSYFISRQWPKELFFKKNHRFKTIKKYCKCIYIYQIATSTPVFLIISPPPPFLPNHHNHHHHNVH